MNLQMQNGKEGGRREGAVGIREYEKNKENKYGPI